MLVKNSTDSKTKKQILTLCNKQDWFLGSITHAQTWDVATLDDITTPNTESLRTVLMDIRTKDKKGKLYLGVKKDTRDNGVFLHSRPLWKLKAAT